MNSDGKTLDIAVIGAGIAGIIVIQTIMNSDQRTSKSINGATGSKSTSFQGARSRP